MAKPGPLPLCHTAIVSWAPVWGPEAFLVNFFPLSLPPSSNPKTLHSEEHRNLQEWGTYKGSDGLSEFPNSHSFAVVKLGSDPGPSAAHGLWPIIWDEAVGEGREEENGYLVCKLHPLDSLFTVTTYLLRTKARGPGV